MRERKKNYESTECRITARSKSQSRTKFKVQCRVWNCRNATETHDQIAKMAARAHYPFDGVRLALECMRFAVCLGLCVWQQSVRMWYELWGDLTCVSAPMIRSFRICICNCALRLCMRACSVFILSHRNVSPVFLWLIALAIATIVLLNLSRLFRYFL